LARRELLDGVVDRLKVSPVSPGQDLSGLHQHIHQLLGQRIQRLLQLLINTDQSSNDCLHFKFLFFLAGDGRGQKRGNKNERSVNPPILPSSPSPSPSPSSPCLPLSSIGFLVCLLRRLLFGLLLIFTGFQWLEESILPLPIEIQILSSHLSVQ